MYTKALRRTALTMSGLITVLTTLVALVMTVIRLGAPNPGGPVAPPVTAVRESAPTLAPLRSARIRAVGDLITHQVQLDFARQADGSYDFHPQYARVAGALADADYTIANLETTIGREDNRAYSGFPNFNTPESLLDTLKDAGIDFLTLANNHILDRGFDGMKLTVDNVARRGFDYAGANRTPEEKVRTVVVDAGGVRVGMLCYTEMTNGMPKKKDSSPARQYGVNYMSDANFEADVRRLREAGAEVVIALPHWGVEYRREPTERMQGDAQRLVAAGVDVVLGSHPHMVQPVTWVEAVTESGEVRRGLVAYSLGNFISNQGKRYTDSGILLDFTLRERETGGFDVTDVKVMPTFCWRQDGAIQTLPALDWYDAPPAGMSGDQWQRLRDSVDDLRELIGDLPMIGSVGEVRD